MQLIFYVVLAAAVSGGVVVTIYYLVQIPILLGQGPDVEAAAQEGP